MMWNPIETAPKDGTEIMLWRDDWPCPIFARWDDTWEVPFWLALESVLADIMGEIESPTHWAPYSLPSAQEG